MKKDKTTSHHISADGTQKRFYWLGHDTPSSQDTFFIEALDPSIWSQGDSSNWDTCWYTGMPDTDTFEQLGSSKTINHIPGNNALTIKSYLNDTLVKAKQHANGTENSKRYDFFPKTYSMPEDYFRFQADAAARPKTLWIQKPKNLSRGRGIEVVKHPETVPFDSEWLIQRYLTDPHLYDGHKYVLRFYVLITSVEPLRFYWYQEGFAKLASETYNENDLDNLYRHLTNPDINEENTDTETPVTFFSFKQYRHWLQQQGHDDSVLFDEFKDLITLTVIAAREKMRHACLSKEADMQGAYELIGLDCMVDNNLKPWILECNLSPSLDTYATAADGANDETTIKRQLVHDLVNMLGLNAKEKLTQSATAIQEQGQQGNFEQLFPGERPNDYLNCFPIPRAKDLFSLPEKTEINYAKINCKANNTNEFLFSDSLALSSNIAPNSTQTHISTQFFKPDDIATWIWIKNSEGLAPSEIAAELAENSPKPETMSTQEHVDKLLNITWNTLADWAQAGVFDNKTITEPNTSNVSNRWPCTGYLLADNKGVKINTACPTAMNYLLPMLTLKTHTDLCDFDINIVKTEYGYSILCGTSVAKENLKLSELMPALINSYFKYNTNDYDHTLIIEANIMRIKQSHFLILKDENSKASRGLDNEELQNSNIISSYCKLNFKTGNIETITLPIKTQDKDKNSTSIIAEAKRQTFYLNKNDADSTETIVLDGIIYLSCDSGNEDNISPLSKADTLIKLWPDIINHQSDSAEKLSEWLEKTATISVKTKRGIDVEDLLHHIISESEVIEELQA